jgi:hypothetical protein
MLAPLRLAPQIERAGGPKGHHCVRSREDQFRLRARRGRRSGKDRGDAMRRAFFSGWAAGAAHRAAHTTVGRVATGPARRERQVRRLDPPYGLRASRASRESNLRYVRPVLGYSILRQNRLGGTGGAAGLAKVSASASHSSGLSAPRRRTSSCAPPGLLFLEKLLVFETLRTPICFGSVACAVLQFLYGTREEGVERCGRHDNGQSSIFHRPRLPPNLGTKGWRGKG